MLCCQLFLYPICKLVSISIAGRLLWYTLYFCKPLYKIKKLYEYEIICNTWHKNFCPKKTMRNEIT